MPVPFLSQPSYFSFGLFNFQEEKAQFISSLTPTVCVIEPPFSLVIGAHIILQRRH
jgi:hypothetical protein